MCNDSSPLSAFKDKVYLLGNNKSMVGGFKLQYFFQIRPKPLSVEFLKTMNIGYPTDKGELVLPVSDSW